jgi:hypothetical protein
LEKGKKGKEILKFFLRECEEMRAVLIAPFPSKIIV